MHGLTMVQARATFQATDFVVLTLTAGPKMVAPAAVAAASWSLGHMPARRRPSNSSSPCMPSTHSPAMPISMPASGHVAWICFTALRVASRSPSPAAAEVSKSRPSAPASSMASATYTMSRVACTPASTCEARASAILPSGSSSDQLGHGPSGME